MDQLFFGSVAYAEAVMHFPDLSPPDAYVWGMMKEIVVQNNPPTTIVELRDGITRFDGRMQQHFKISKSVTNVA